MQDRFQHLIQEATRLTREGDLQAATQAIQHALQGRQAAAGSGGDVIDVEARVVDAPAARALPSGGGDRPAPAPAPAPSGEEAFVPGRHGGAGTAGRDYKLFVPAQPAQPGALVLMLHGCTQGPDDFAAGTRMNDLARERGWHVLYPAQAQRANSHRCWNWFKHSHQQRGRGEAALVAGMVREVVQRYGIDPGRVFVAGLSAGGAMAAILGQAYPELFAAVGVHSGLPAGAARDLPGALEAMKNGASPPVGAGASLPTIVFHGDADRTVHPANGEHVVRAAAAAGEAQTEPVQGRGRRATRRVYRDAAGCVLAEHWLVHGAGHAWMGGSAAGSYTDPSGPDASREMVRFFEEQLARKAS
ncbi:MAG TPA: PHB depolymerase family esterase [Ramlibacter sp.]|nr:PHB depolymerase family esterase [Ramlibacter sp.]